MHPLTYDDLYTLNIHYPHQNKCYLFNLGNTGVNKNPILGQIPNQTVHMDNDH